MTQPEWTVDQRKYAERLATSLMYKETGKVLESAGLLYRAYLPGASVGSLCRIHKHGFSIGEGIDAEVIGFNDKTVALMPFEEVHGINNQSSVTLAEQQSTVRVGRSLLGRVIDGRGNAIDGRQPLRFAEGTFEDRALYAKAPNAVSRRLITQPLDLGIRAINGLLSAGQGQRLGIMAGSGVGKSVLLGMMARNTTADVNVIALIGERGREVREFIENDLGPEGLRRSIVVVATSDASPLLRMRAAFLATTIAEYFRDQRKNVVLMMDSITRFAMAQREIGLSLGEPPASKGYTPSVFSLLPKLLERAGTGVGAGSVTGLYTVLVEGDDMDDPIADSVRSIIDGHIVLTRELAQRNHFPAIDVLKSASRVMPRVVDQNHTDWAGQLREWLAVYGQAEDLINIGAYARGSNPRIDQAIEVYPRIEAFLRQPMGESTSFDETLAQMHGIVRAAEAIARANEPQQNQPR
jgi:flagellum-specific ATP synthase